MANRAYLYSVDEIPGEEKKRLAIKGLSEWDYSIPPVYLFLVSGNTRLCNSIIYEYSVGKISLIGNYEKGIQNLEKLIDLLKKNDIQHKEVFNRVANEAIEFLKSDKHRQKYILLEPGEIYAMDDGASEEKSNWLVKDAKDLLENVKQKNLDSINRYIGDDIKIHWEDLLGINRWSEILYFHFK